jgi:hypothetical protein
MEDVRPILKRATDSITRIRKKRSGSKAERIEQTKKAVEKIGKNMELLINEVNKTGQEAVQTSIALVRLTMIQSTVFR